MAISLLLLFAQKCSTRRIRDYEKDGGCTFYQNALRSEIVKKVN